MASGRYQMVSGRWQMVSDGVNKVSDGVRKVLDGVKKVSDGVVKQGSPRCHLGKEFCGEGCCEGVRWNCTFSTMNQPWPNVGPSEKPPSH